MTTRPPQRRGRLRTSTSLALLRRSWATAWARPSTPIPTSRTSGAGGETEKGSCIASVCGVHDLLLVLSPRPVDERCPGGAPSARARCRCHVAAGDRGPADARPLAGWHPADASSLGRPCRNNEPGLLQKGMTFTIEPMLSCGERRAAWPPRLGRGTCAAGRRDLRCWTSEIEPRLSCGEEGQGGRRPEEQGWAVSSSYRC